MTSLDSPDDLLIRRALAEARETKALVVGDGARNRTAELFVERFGRVPALVVADENTLAAAGLDVCASLRQRGLLCGEPFVFAKTGLYAEDRFTRLLQEALSAREGIPVAVGAGTINDLTKLVAHRLGRPYLAVATAASMDGYTAFGASVTRDGLKQTFECPAPAAVLADSEVIAAAPESLTASGYADLAAKVTAGADWLLADALGVEPVDGPAWGLVQDRLREWLRDPVGVRQGDRASIRRLTIGLMMGGFAMQRTRSSRPASGAEHQFSHLWDMQHHTHRGSAPSHGFKVGIGTLASAALYERLLALPMHELDVERCCASWPDRAAAVEEAEAAFTTPELKQCAARETGSKYVEAAELRRQLGQLRQAWPPLAERLRRHLVPLSELRRMLQEAGCPTRPEEIGISRERLRDSYRQSYFIRRRFTVLDLARRAGVWDECLRQLFGPGGVWAEDSLSIEPRLAKPCGSEEHGERTTRGSR